LEKNRRNAPAIGCRFGSEIEASAMITVLALIILGLVFYCFLF